MFALVPSLLKIKTAEMVILCMAEKIAGSDAIQNWKLPIAVDVLVNVLLCICINHVTVGILSRVFQICLPSASWQ